VVADHTAGSPVDENILWTNQSPRQIAEELEEQGFSVCSETVRNILTEELHLGLRQASKDEPASECAFRDEQFEYIADLRAWYERRHWPVLSIDTKKKELLGDFFRDGHAYTNGVVHVSDHDFAPPGQGRLVPYGVFDIQRNEGFVLLSVGPDTSLLACDTIWRWWQRMGHRHYWHASGLLVFCDCGGSNGNRHYVFKEALYDLACRLRRPIQVAHYPAGCSKYNPIEHRMFCHVNRAMQGVVLRSIEVAKTFISQTSTSNGLQVIVETARKLYEKGRKASQAFMNSLPVHFDDFLPALNYTLHPHWQL
jgi:hypothetical protein